jgi:hypothetical protein
MPRTTPGQGVLLKPTFNSVYGVVNIEVLDGGTGYAQTDPPKIVIEGTATPSVEGVFYPKISGVGTVSEIVIFKTGAGYFPIFNQTEQSGVVVERGAFGSIATSHASAGLAYSVFAGDYNIVDDNIFFSDAPYGKTGPQGLQTNSSFSGRLFSRKLDSFDPKDKNVILDDISLEFTGISGTQFSLSENSGIVTSLYNSVNTGVDINNNPFILINNVVQTPGLDFEVVDNAENKLNFLSGVPRAGRISKVGLQTGAGYYIPQKATVRVGVGSTGSLEHIQIEGKGQGYRTVPEISIRSSQGYGASITALLGQSSTTSVAISTAIYNHIAGIATFTTGSAHGFEIDDRVRITGAGFTFAPVTAARNIGSFGYDYITGIATIQVYGGHYIGTAGNQSKNLLVKEVQVTEGISTFLFREDGYPIVSIATTEIVTVMAGVGTQPLTYVSGGLVQAGIDTAIMDGRNVTGFDIIGTTANTFKAFVGISSFAHNYVGGGVVNRAEAGIITNFSIVEGGTGFFTPKHIEHINQNPPTGITTITAIGDKDGDSKNINALEYDSLSGVATITAASAHGLTTASVVKLSGIAFSTGVGDIIFPSDTQKYFGVTGIVSTLNFNVNIGIAMTTTGIHTANVGSGIGSYIPYKGHGLENDDFIQATGIAVTFTSAPAVQVGHVEYDESSGIATVTTRKDHNLTEDDCVVLSGIAFTCDYDPALNIGTAAYDNITGVLTVTTAAPHGYKVGKDVILTGLAFTCALDNGAYQHYYPRSRSTAYDTSIPIVGYSGTALEVDVGISRVKNQYIHRFEEALPGALIYGGDYPHKFLRAEEGALLTGGPYPHVWVNSTATSTFAGGDYAHTYVSSDAKTIKVGGDYEHQFVPSETKPNGVFVIEAGANITVSNADYDPGTGSLILTDNGHNFTGPTQHSITTANYNPIVGIMTLTMPNHGFANGDQVRIADESIGWKCSLDAFTTTKYYPRSTDPISDSWLPISNVSTNTFEVFAGITTRLDYTVSGADYTPSVGVMTMSIGFHDLEVGQSIKFRDGSLGFSCEADAYIATKYYPRAKDPTYNTAVPIIGAAGTTITVNVGISTIVKYNIRNADYTPAVGVMTVSVDRLHGFQAGESIKFKPGSLVFKCEQDGFQTNHFYPRPTDPYYDKPVEIIGAAGTIFTVNVGPTTSANVYQFLPNQGVAVEGVISGGDYPYTLVGVGTDAVITGGGDYTPYVYVSSTANNVERPSMRALIQEGALSFKCAKDDYATIHAYPRKTDPAYNTNLGIVSVTANTFEVRVGVSTIEERSISTSTYNPATGDFVMNVGVGHSYINESAHTISTATYNPSTGVLEPTIANHGFVAGEYVKFDLESITFKCDKDGYTANKAYPRYSDPYLNKWLPIYNVGVNTFSVFVGISTIVNTHWFQSATTGGLKKARDTVGINTASIIFTCARDNYATEHAYPRPDDPIGGNVSVGIGSTSADTITINVGVSTIVNYNISTASYTASTGIMTVFSNVHGFNGSYTRNVEFATYDAGSGIMTVTSAGHGMVTGNRVQFERDSIRFRCKMDGRLSIKSYPRRKDPSDQKWLSVTTVDLDKFSVNVGTSPLVYHTPTSGSYDPFTGLMTIDIGSHTLQKGTSVKLKTNGFKFTCALDNHATFHYYPRKSGLSGPDPAYNTAVKITATTDTTITLDVGTSSNQTEHILVSAVNNAVISGGNYLHTFENAKLGGLLIARDTIGLATDSYTFRCAQDGYATDHTYPRSTDPIHNVEVGVVTSTLDTFTINVGITSRVKFNVTNATYDANSGLATITTDSSHGLSTVTSVGLATGGLVYSCAMDQYATEHPYPRPTDPAHNTALYPTSVTSNNVTLNVGVSTRVAYNINHADYHESIGIMTAYLPVVHGITTAAGIGRNVKLRTEGILFSCSQDNYTTKQFYPKGGDPYYNGSIITRVINNNVIETQVGPSTTPSFYNGGGKIQGVILAPRLNNNSPSGTDFAAGGTFVDKIIDNKTYVVNVGISTVDHNYARAGLSQKGKRIASSIEQGFSGFDVIEKLDAATFRVNAGLTTQKALYKRGGEVTKPVFVDVTEPDKYFNEKLVYASGNSGIGTNSKVDFRINVDGNIAEFNVLEEGSAFKVGDKLTVSGIATDPRVGVLTEFQLTVEELENDSFSGFYPGQFILFDDISPFFNGTRKKFTLSVTTSGSTEILSLKTLPGSDMDITNNIFIYINDILQTPQTSYIYKGSRVIFTEAPKPNSKCSVFYFRGSKRDVETVEPISSLKPGDTVQIKENRFDVTDIDQFERTSKRIVASDLLETFTYNSIGINTAQDAERPLSWEKQRGDQILSGVLVSKARPSLSSKVLPTTRLIKNVGKTDDTIYVNNVYPLFNAIDKLLQSENTIQIFDDNEIIPGVITSIVSTSSSISSLTISYGGTGYSLTNPEVSISNSKINRKDPISDWKFDGISGIIQAVNFKAITQSEPYVAVGSSSYYMNTKSGTFWERGQIGFGNTVQFNGVGMGYSQGNTNTNYVMAVGDGAAMARAVSIGNSMSAWTPIDLKEKRVIPAINVTNTFDSTYTGSFKDVIWERSRDTWVAVGAAGSIFTAVGMTTAEAFSQYSGTLETLNSIAYGQAEFIAVGNGGAVIASNDGIIWSDKVSNTVQDINDIIYDGSKFIFVGNNGTIGLSTNKNFWQPYSQQLPAGTQHPATFDFAKIKYFNNFYIGISTVGDVYYSFDLANWNKRDITHPNEIRDIANTPYGNFNSTRILAVGSGTTQFYADPVLNRAAATASVTAGVITSVVVTDGGFGYDVGSSPPVIVQTDKTRKEDIFSINAVGDFGDIVGINTWLPGTANVLPRLAFTLKSQFNDNTNLGYGYSSLNQLGVNFTGLEKGDFFTIYDSPLVVGHALTGITTSSGSNVAVGMVTEGDYLGGVFRVETITPGDAVSGLATVTCAFLPGPISYGNNVIQVGLAVTANTDTFWGKYSWGKIFGYQNRGSGNPEEFFVNNMNGNTGLSTASVVSRKKPLT